MKGGTSSPTTTKLSVGNATNHIFMSWRLYILLHFLASHALKACLFKVWESKSRISVNCHKVPECKQLHLNHCQLQIIMENVSLYQSNWHTFVYISVSEDSRLQLMVRFTLWRLMFIRKTPFTCTAQSGWKPRICNIVKLWPELLNAKKYRKLCIIQGIKISILNI